MQLALTEKPPSVRNWVTGQQDGKEMQRPEGLRMYLYDLVTEGHM